MNPFEKHRDKVLGQYSTAKWLREVVLSLYSGGYPATLTRISNADDNHRKAFFEMVEYYAQHGENDAAFMSLAQECIEMRKAEAQAEVREERLTAWMRELKLALMNLGQAPGEADDHYSWFEGQFDLGISPDAAAVAFVDKLRAKGPKKGMS